MKTFGQHIRDYDAELARERRESLERLRARITSQVMNLPCDLSATAPEHHSGTRHGHKQARHKAIDVINEAFAEEIG